MMQQLLNALSAWAPLILIAVVWAWVMKLTGAFSYKTFVQKTLDLSNAQLGELRQINERLERIETALQEQKQERSLS